MHQRHESRSRQSSDHLMTLTTLTPPCCCTVRVFVLHLGPVFVFLGWFCVVPFLVQGLLESNMVQRTIWILVHIPLSCNLSFSGFLVVVQGPSAPGQLCECRYSAMHVSHYLSSFISPIQGLCRWSGCCRTRTLSL
jgi:hypothetical protein